MAFGDKYVEYGKTNPKMKPIFERLRNVSFWQSLQMIVLCSLLVDILVPVPPRFTTYAIGSGFVISFVHWCLLPKQEKWNPAWKYALPYLVFYALMLVSGIFSGDIFLSLQRLWRYTPLLFIPMIFVGMTPTFFTRKRIRILAISFVFGILIGYLWRFGVLIFDYGNLGAVKEYGWGKAFQDFYRSVFITPRTLTFHPAFEALFQNLAIAIVLIAWIKNDVFFNRRYKKVLAVIYVFLLSVNVFLFCTKTSALCLGMVFFSVWIYAFYKKNHRFFCVLSILFCVCVCGVVFLFVKQGGVLVERYHDTEKAIKSFVEEDGNGSYDGSFVPRWYCYLQTKEMFKERPVMGWGPAYGKEFQARFKEKYADKTRYPEGLKYPHNELFEVMLMGGILGVLISVWVLLSAMCCAKRGGLLYGWLWFGCLVIFCIVESIFDQTIGFVYLCGVHGVLFCQGLLLKEETLLPEKPL